MALFRFRIDHRREDVTDENAEPVEELVSTWESRTPAVVMVILLIAIVVIPPLVGLRISTLRTEIAEVAEHARARQANIAIDVAREAAALRGYLLTGEEEFRDQFREARDGEAEAFAELRSLAQRLDPDLAERVDNLQALHSEAHAIGAEVLAGRISRNEYLENLSLQEASYESFVAASRALDIALTAEVSERREAIELTQRLQTLAIVALALLTLVAALLMARLGGRFRALAVRLRKLAREEAALSRVARTLSAVGSAGEVVERVAASALEAVQAQAAYVERVRPGGMHVEIVAVTGSRYPARGTRAAYPGSISGDRIVRAEPEVVAVRAMLAEQRSTAQALEAGCGDCSALVVPLSSEGETLGALVLLREAGQPAFQADEVGRGRTLADLASLALRRALLLEEREQILAEEQGARALAEGAVRTRDKVLGIVAHDLRNPLGAILTSSSFLLDIQLPEEGRTKQLQIIHRSSVRMNRLIQDLLDVARIESGGLAIDPRCVEVAPLVTEACQFHAGAAAEKGVRLDCKVAEGLPALHADEDRLHQVFANLIGNAIKFTDGRGKVIVMAEAVGSGVHFSVADTGPGIPDEDQPRIFDAHWQAGATAHLGSGLGLAIAKGIVETHGGRIWVESAPWVGTTFHFTIPAADG
jgi:signal transduction histidine kinase/CHASE3 domain sensor protein